MKKIQEGVRREVRKSHKKENKNQYNLTKAVELDISRKHEAKKGGML